MASYWDPIRKMLGCPDDAEAAGDGSIIAILKRLRTLLGAPIIVSGAVTVADGADVAQGATDDAEAVAGDGTVIAVLKRLRTLLGGALTITGDAYTTPTHTAVNVTTNTGEVLAANVDRLHALLVNDSDVIIYVKLGAAAVANEGIRLNAAGGSYEMSALLGNLYTGAINGIHAGVGNKVLLVLEGT